MLFTKNQNSYFLNQKVTLKDWKKPKIEITFKEDSAFDLGRRLALFGNEIKTDSFKRNKI